MPCIQKFWDGPDGAETDDEHVHNWPDEGNLIVWPCEMICGFCGADILDTTDLRNHVRQKHGKDRPKLKVLSGFPGGNVYFGRNDDASGDRAWAAYNAKKEQTAAANRPKYPPEFRETRGMKKAAEKSAKEVAAVTADLGPTTGTKRKSTTVGASRAAAADNAGTKRKGITAGSSRVATATNENDDDAGYGISAAAPAKRRETVNDRPATTTATSSSRAAAAPKDTKATKAKAKAKTTTSATMAHGDASNSRVDGAGQNETDTDGPKATKGKNKMTTTAPVAQGDASGPEAGVSGQNETAAIARTTQQAPSVSELRVYLDGLRMSLRRHLAAVHNAGVPSAEVSDAIGKEMVHAGFWEESDDDEI